MRPAKFMAMLFALLSCLTSVCRPGKSLRLEPILVAPDLAACREGILPSPVGASRPPTAAGTAVLPER
jgi:hypothetical protein